jgi:hypothetical protein
MVGALWTSTDMLKSGLEEYHTVARLLQVRRQTLLLTLHLTHRKGIVGCSNNLTHPTIPYNERAWYAAGGSHCSPSRTTYSEHSLHANGVVPAAETVRGHLGLSDAQPHWTSL